MTSRPPHIALGGGAEFDLIRRLQQRWGPLATGLGDDAAELTVPRGETLVASTDAAIEDVHFRRGWLTWREVGYRAVTAALSDLAAMAASPLGILVSLATPDDAMLDELADGIGDAVRSADTIIVGGNLARSEQVALTTTALGSVMTPLRRIGAHSGHLVYVTGRLGGPAAAIRALEEGSVPEPALRERFARPVARIREARWLAAHGATAAIDISDGLAGDAGHLAMANGVALEISLEMVPRVAGASDEDLLGGEEYELLVTAAAPLPVDAFQERFGCELTLVGQVVRGDRVIFLGDTRIAGSRGHDHFSR